MSHSIDQWLKHLDAIMEQQAFETEAEAETWLREQSKNCSVEEFFERCATPAMRLKMLWQIAEDAIEPEAAHRAYRKAVGFAEKELASDIAAARRDPVSWAENKAHPYLLSLFGQAASAEMLGDLGAAESMYQRVWDADPLDSLGCVEKLFSLSVTDGRLADARKWLDQLAADDSTIVHFHRALLRFLEAADEAEQRYQETGDLDAASSWQDEIANALLARALLANPYVARLMAHPQAFQLDCPRETDAGSPAEAISVMFASAHLWLSDFLALSWLIARAKESPQDIPGYENDWQNVIEKLGGEPSDEERFAYLRSLEETEW